VRKNIRAGAGLAITVLLLALVLVIAVGLLLRKESEHRPRPGSQPPVTLPTAPPVVISPEATRLAAENSALKEEVGRLQGELQTAAQRLAASEERLKIEQAAPQELRAAIEAQKVANDTIARENMALKSRAETAEEKCAELAKRVEAVTREYNFQLAAGQGVRQQLAARVAELKELNAKNTELAGQIQALQAKIAELTAAREQLETAVKTLSARISDLEKTSVRTGTP